MRQTDLSAVTFPVEMRPIHFSNDHGKQIPIKTHNVVVNKRTEGHLGVVNAGYRLVTNQEAVNFAKDCASQLFGEIQLDNLEVFNVYAPERPWCCHIDLIHKGFEVNFFKKEVYLPFVRVTNSYNGMRALRFDIGYCRKLCLNGVIFEREAIEFKFTHSRSAIGKRLDFKIAKGKLEALRQKFETDAERLHRFQIPVEMELPIFFKALVLPLPTENEDLPQAKQQFFQEITRQVSLLIKEYFGRLGPNAYALFNAMTEFASYPPEIKYFRRSPHSMQVLAGTWSRTFADELAKSGGHFNPEAYLGDYCRLFISRIGKNINNPCL